MTDESMLLRLALRSTDCEALERLVDTHGWIVEAEVVDCLGMASFFEDAVVAAMVELVCHARKYCPQQRDAKEWIRAQAERASRRVVDVIEDRYVEDGVIEVRSADCKLQALVGSLMDRTRSPYRENHFPQQRSAVGPLSREVRASNG
jgi:hypothetical protein